MPERQVPTKHTAQSSRQLSKAILLRKPANMRFLKKKFNFKKLDRNLATKIGTIFGDKKQDITLHIFCFRKLNQTLFPYLDRYPSVVSSKNIFINWWSYFFRSNTRRILYVCAPSSLKAVIHKKRKFVLVGCWAELIPCSEFGFFRSFFFVWAPWSCGRKCLNVSEINHYCFE